VPKGFQIADEIVRNRAVHVRLHVRVEQSDEVDVRGALLLRGGLLQLGKQVGQIEEDGVW
jgi:hypothetical protein